MKIQTLAQFYGLMNKTRDIRRAVVSCILSGDTVKEQDVQELVEAHDVLDNIQHVDGKSRVMLDSVHTIDLDLGYEINELKKDIYYLTRGEDAFFEWLGSLHPGFKTSVSEGVLRHKDVHFKNFITDRDGTINNYCGRYASSIQSVYNAVFLTRFAQKVIETGIVLTSAPLDNIGLVDISVAPSGVLVYAGSKGREYFTKNGERRTFPIEKEKEKVLQVLNDKLKALVSEPPYQKYSLIGSGLQFKFGQTTMARQDISRSVPQDESEAFLQLIVDMVQTLDPEKKYFRIEDTGKDIEIILTIEDEGAALRDFDKGDGITFLNEDMGMRMHEGTSLICGDTKSDIPMIPASQKLSQDTWSIFVTRDEELANEIRRIGKKVLIVPEPDMLVSILYKLAKKEY